MEQKRKGPWSIKPNVRLRDVRFIPLDDLKGIRSLEDGDWYQQWLGLVGWQPKAIDLLNLRLCPVLEEFASRLFHSAVPFGVIHCKISHLKEPERTWLVFGKANEVPAARGLKAVLEAPIGDLFFLHKPSNEVGVFGENNLVERFFLSFGGLRDSCPFFKGDHFFECPWPIGPFSNRTFHSVEPEWAVVDVLHARKHIDYLVLNDAGMVGYVPIEPDRRIQLYAKSFSEAILKWLNDPLRDWQAMSAGD